MRASMLSTACDVGVPDAVSWAKQKFAAWIDHGTAYSASFTLSLRIISASIYNAQFTPPARHDKTVLSVSCQAV